MKRMIITSILTVAGLGLFGVQAYLAKVSKDTKGQPYRVIKQASDFEIRHYPPAVEASVIKKGPYRNMMNGGFRDLANYIFGGNKEGSKIAMTSPVKSVHRPKQKEAEITFVMPQDFEMKGHPEPLADDIRFRETEPLYAAAMSFGGFASVEDMAQKAEILRANLKQQGLSWEEPAQYLYYNPPYQMIDRRNEVLFVLKDYEE
jgi:hypothetical protein